MRRQNFRMSLFEILGIPCRERNRRRGIVGAIFCAIIFMTSVSYCHAQDISDTYTEQNPDTGYQVVIEDNADLLTGEQENSLAAVMRDITAYGNVAFKTIDNNHTSAESFARNYYKDQFGTKSGTLFLIDMDNRMLWIHSDGAVYRTVTKSYAETITDNVYRKASAADYYGCAVEVYGQIFTLLEGDRIAQPMKYISNILLAMILALLINYAVVCYFTKMKKPKEDAILRKLEKHFSCTAPEAV